MELAAATEVAHRFRLRERIGEGGMGVVWSAEDNTSGELVALKFVKDSGSPTSQHRRLIREARAACAVHHPCVVRVHDILDLEDGTPVMVMEFLTGESLGDKLERDKELPLAEFARVMQSVVSAVGTAHASGVIHRDLKPENIFMVANGQGAPSVKILDFGIAKLTPGPLSGGSITELTRTGSLLGTPFYMAPEQVFGERDIDHRADIWALGVIFYQSLSGILPTKAENVGQVMKIITTRRIWPLQQAAPDLPQDLTDLVNRMLSRDRDARPPSLAEVREVLSRYTDATTPDFDTPAGRPSAPAPAPDEPSGESLGEAALARPMGSTLVSGAAPARPVDKPTIAQSGSSVVDEFASTVQQGASSTSLADARTDSTPAKGPPRSLMVAAAAAVVLAVGAGWFGFSASRDTSASSAPGSGVIVAPSSTPNPPVTASADLPPAPSASVASAQPVATRPALRQPRVAALPKPKRSADTVATKPPAPAPAPTATSIGGVVLDSPF